MTTYLEQYLGYYTRLWKPGYAVLVTGAWGSGKTHQVKACVHVDNSIYVSLYGVDTIEQLHGEVFAAAFPKHANIKQYTDGSEKKLPNTGGVLSLLSVAPAFANAALRRNLQSDPRTLIFDDLERCSIDLDSLLGVINGYVEQQELKVIIIAHDEKVEREFSEKQEKLIGQTIRINPQINMAFEHFVNLLDGNYSEERDVKLIRALFSTFKSSKQKADEVLSVNAARAFIEKYRDTILETFDQSGHQSLRVLRHTIADLARLRNILSKDILANEISMDRLVRFFTVFDIETRAGVFTGNDLLQRQRSILAEHLSDSSLQNENEKSSANVFSACQRKYETVDLGDDFFSDELLNSIFSKGLYDETKINNSLVQSSYFSSIEDISAPIIFQRFHEYDDDVIYAAIEKMNQQLNNQSIVNVHEVLNIFSVKLMMAKYKFNEDTFADVVRSGKDYIDALIADNHELVSPFEAYKNKLPSTNNGYGYMVDDKTMPYFTEIKNHLHFKLRKIFDSNSPNIAKSLLQLLKDDHEKFILEVCHTKKGAGSYALVPILHHIPVKDFVDTWLALPEAEWGKISRALNERYRESRLSLDLKDEGDWALELLTALRSEVDEVKKLRALRIENVIPRILVAIFEEDQPVS